jgi:antitoxin HigA-1
MASKPKLLDPIPPGEILMEEFMRPMGLSINALARALAVPANRVSAIVKGTRAISADTALRLGKYFGTSPEMWLDLQSDYELRVARQTTWARVEPRVQTRVA